MAVIESGSMTLESSSQSEEQMRSAIEAPSVEAEGAAVAVEPSSGVLDSEAGKLLAGKKKSLQARIDEITKEKYDGWRERDEALAKAARLESELQSLKAPKAPKAPAQSEQPVSREATSRKPSQDQFATYDDYVEALTDWKLEQREIAAKQHEAQRQRFASIEQRDQSYLAKIKPHLDADPTLFGKWVTNDQGETVLAPGETPRIHPYLQSLVPLSKMSPDALKHATAQNAIAEHFINADDPVALLLHFTDHPDDFQRLSTLSPMELSREMGKLEARLTAPSATVQTQQVSKAKPPIRPVGSSPVAPEPNLDDTSIPLSELLKRRRAAARR